MRKTPSFDFQSKAALAGILLLLGLLTTTVKAGNALEIRDGYFWNPESGSYFLARGVAYQTWNPPVFANQSLDQIAYDLREFSKMRANSVRAELVWGELEIAEDTYDWTRADFLIQTAEQLGLKLFLLIGYQYPPLGWFPASERCLNDRGTVSDVLNYESPVAQAAYAEHIATVVARYKDSPAIGGWILGNEFAYFDLWEDPALYPARRMLGYDPRSVQAFRDYLDDLYGGNIAALNANWGTSYAGFGNVVMPPAYPENRNEPGYHDVIQWRQQSIARFVALGAKAAKDNDPNHLITYSMVGGIFSGSDANNTGESPQTIVRHCADIGAPLDFWSVNNYAWATEGSELRSADFGIAKYQELIGLPVMVSETGHSSTEDLLPGASPRQPKALPGTVWEGFGSGAIGVHFFHWSDRHNFNEAFFIRERGFGIVGQNRLIKSPVYGNMESLLRRMEEIDIANLLGGSTNPGPDVLLFQTPAGEMGFPRGNQENTMLWGALKRAGYQLGLMDDEALEAGNFRGAKALVFSRCEQLKPSTLDRAQNVLVPAGIHLHANCDLPGQFNAYRQPNANWASRMSGLFGVNVATANAAWYEGVSGGFGETYRDLSLNGTITFGRLNASFNDSLLTWRIWHGVQPVTGTTVLTHKGLHQSAPGSLALHVRNHGTAKTALNTFAMGDIFGSSSPTHLWDLRSQLVGAIYRDYFGIVPKIQITGTGAAYVMPDYRICRNGSLLLSVLNEHDGAVNVTLQAAGLLAGKTVERLSSGGILEANSDGVLNLSLPGDEYLLLYAYDENGGPSPSLVDPAPYRVWFNQAPQAVWPSLAGYPVQVGFDTRGENLQVAVTLESLHAPATVRGGSAKSPANGVGSAPVTVPVPDANLLDPTYRSTPDGGRYQLRARLEKNGATVAESTIPIRLLWGVRPTALPPVVVAGGSYLVGVAWQELPGYEPGEAPTSIDRADLWDSAAATNQHYNITLQLRNAAQGVVASGLIVTREATGSHSFSIGVPGGAIGPFHWYASARTAPGASNDIVASFEGLVSGAAVPYDPRTKVLDETVIGQTLYTGELGGPRMSGLPASPGSVAVNVTINGVARVLADNGSGLLVGTGGDTGTVDYATGVVTLAFGPTPLTGDLPIVATFQPVGIPDPGIIEPWVNYTYAHLGNPGRIYLNHGIHIQGFHGSQSIFQVLSNPPDVGDFSGFGLARIFDTPIALPSTPQDRARYRFSFAFRENAQFGCRLELQLKDAQVPAGVLLFGKTYDPQAFPHSWDTIGATLDQFQVPPWSPQPLFDYSRVKEILCNVAMLEKDRFYLASIDDIRFDGPEAVITGGTIRAVYDSRDDALLDRDHDGIPDQYETGGGIFAGPTNTGTDPDKPDTDGDGEDDGDELIAGTNPNASADRFHIAGVTPDGIGGLLVSWKTRAGRTYELEFHDPAAPPALPVFATRPAFPPLPVVTNGMVSVTVPIEAAVRTLVVRVRVRISGN